MIDYIVNDCIVLFFNDRYKLSTFCGKNLYPSSKIGEISGISLTCSNFFRIEFCEFRDVRRQKMKLSMRTVQIRIVFFFCEEMQPRTLKCCPSHGFWEFSVLKRQWVQISRYLDYFLETRFFFVSQRCYFFCRKRFLARWAPEGASQSISKISSANFKLLQLFSFSIKLFDFF